jgi:xylan 1,4-beta-xylosidase
MREFRNLRRFVENYRCATAGGPMRSIFTAVAVVVVLIAGSPARADEATVAFDWFEYTGRDTTSAAPLPAGSYRNPILGGYYPDPSVTRVGDKFYLVNSTFAHFPGIPIHESTDLVNWKLVGHALNNPSTLSFDGLNISRGVFAPSIHFNKGLFYIVNTLVEAGGNFFVTASKPAGPWSAPVWLPEIDGIDPSFFFDDDGKAYILNNGSPEGPPLYDGHRAIWIQQFDLGSQKLIGPRKVIVNGGVDLAKKPIWIEGPHLYRIKGWYYLLCAEGGTGDGHSEVILRGKSPWGPFEPYQGNPILTQRDLPANRPDPVTNAGHADLVQMKDGSWWAVFLASRPYSGSRYNTGRETFLLPVTWKNGWPVILEPGKPIPYVVKGPAGLQAAKGDALSGNFTKRDEFDGALGPEWIQVHVPKQSRFEFFRGALRMRPLPVNLDERRNASFLARRQQHLNFDASTELVPPAGGFAAGLAAYQSEQFWYFFGARRIGKNLQLFLERSAGKGAQIVTGTTIAIPKTLKLRVSADGPNYSFFFDAGSGWTALVENDDGSILSTEVAGGFVGTVLGPFSRQE